jgi:hypothetical protein
MTDTHPLFILFYFILLFIYLLFIYLFLLSAQEKIQWQKLCTQ